MSVTAPPPPPADAAAPAPAPAPPPNTVTLTIDGQQVTVPKGTNVLEAARTLGVDITAFCYHPGLPIVAQCRQCLVAVEKNPKLQPSCQQVCGDGMVVHTTDKQSTLARQQQLEFTLLNHPVDCPICDKAGECTLQRLYFEADNQDSRVDVEKVHKAKVVDLGPTIVLDQERCILCSRCIRTCDVVAGEHQLEFAHRGDREVLTTAPGAQLDNAYSLNTVDVCPVGALTAKDFRFTMRAWELDATPSVCNGCATGCNIEVHHKNGRAWRLVPRHNPEVNKYWMCDEGRTTYHDLRVKRLAVATVDGLPAGWDGAMKAIASRVAARRNQPSSIAIVLSALCTNEDNFALGKLAKALNITQVYVAGHPLVPERADGRLRVADVNPNLNGVTEIAQALGLSALPANQMDPGAHQLVIALGDVFPGMESGRLREIDVIALAAHERGYVEHASIGLPIAEWAEVSATVTNDKGHVQRMHAAFPAPGQAIAGWEAIARIAQAIDVKLAAAPYVHARDVFKDMTATVGRWNGLTWARDARPLALRFAGSRG